MTQGFPQYAVLRCPDCGTELSPALLSCPHCRRLVHGERLNRLAAWAKQATAAGDLAGALGAWREALELLPPDSKQFATVMATVSALSREVDARDLKPMSRPGPAGPAGPAGPVGPVGLSSPAPSSPAEQKHAKRGAASAAGAIGAAVVFLLTKAKLLLFGLTKASTFFSMLLSIGAYWAIYGWKFALGLVLSIYVHEMGHVAMLRRFGMRATAPMFIPGLGALIRLQQHPANPIEDARIGLAGPIWGLGAALICSAVWLATRWPAWLAIASVGAWVNLFNLLPVWQLDGGRGFRALSKPQRWIVVATMAAMYFLTHEGLLIALLAFGILRIFSDIERVPPEGDKRTLYEFVFLVITLSLLAWMRVPTGAL
jgi:Zn-dependent protease